MFTRETRESFLSRTKNVDIDSMKDLIDKLKQELDTIEKELIKERKK